MKVKDILTIVLCLVTFVSVIGTLQYFNYEHHHNHVHIQIDQPLIPTEPQPVEPKVLKPSEAIKLIKEDKIKKAMTYLASNELEGRMSGKEGNKKAFLYVEEMCKKFGLPTERQRFNIQKLNLGPKGELGEGFTENLYAWIEGSDPKLKDEIVVLGAHLDHIGYGPSMSRSRKIAVHPGADDNASGSVCLLAIAQAYSRMKPGPRTVVFQWYSAEEMGLIGSRHYVNNPTFPKSSPDIKKHIFMLNMDMVGRLNGGVYNVAFHSGESSLDIARYINELNPKYPFAKKITSRGSGGSDHASFYNKRIPVCFLHTGLHADYHTPDDTVDKINFKGMELISKYALELSYKVIYSNAPPSFNDADFKPMSYDHDHGHGIFHSHVHN